MPHIKLVTKQRRKEELQEKTALEPLITDATSNNKHMIDPRKGPLPHLRNITVKHTQSNLNSSNTDGSFTMASTNSFLSPYEILPLAQENKYLGKFSYFIMKLYVVCAH